MKKLRFACLSFLLVLCGALLSACGDGVFADTIYFNDYQSSSSVIEIETNQRLDVTVEMLPSNVTDREFEVTVLDEGKQGLLSFEYDYSAKKVSIIATGNLGGAKTVNLSIKLKAKMSDASSVARVRIVAPDSPEIRALSSPDVAIDENGILSWSRVDGASSYFVQICEGQNVLRHQTIKNALSCQLNLNDYAGKSITAKVQAKAKTSDLDSEFSILYFDVLTAPKNLSFRTDTQRIVWDEVENSNGYNLKIGDKIVHTQENYFDANGYFDIAGETEVCVMSAGSNDNRYLQSAYSSKINVARLPSASGWQLESDYLSWDLIDDAVKYEIKISNGDENIFLEAERNYIDLSKQKLEAGVHSIYVIPVGENIGATYCINGEARRFNFEKLQKVSGLRLEDGKIKWNSTAANFRILIDGRVFKETRTTSFDYSQLASQTMTDFDVVAVGDNISRISSDSLFGNGLKIYRLTAPELSFDGNGTVSWDVLSNASGYQIVLDNNITISKTKNQTTASILSDSLDYSTPTNFAFFAKGDVDGPIVNAQIYLNSETVYRTISQLGTVNLQFSKFEQEDCLTWSGANAGGYKIFATDGQNNFESDVIYQSYFAVSNFVSEQNISANKVYTVRAKVMAQQTDGKDWYLSSVDSEAISITKLSNVDLFVQNGVVSWNYQDVDHILGYHAVLKTGEQSIDVENLSQTANEYDFKTESSGVYTFELVAIGDTSKNYISSSKSQITIAKLQTIENVKVSKTTATSFDAASDKYTISFEDPNEGNATYVCKIDDVVENLTKDGNTYWLEVYGSQIGQKMNIKILIGGDNEQYINCAGFEFNLSKYDQPIVSTNQDGDAIDTNANKYFGLVKVDGQELAQTFEGIKTDPILLATGSQFKLKSVAFEDDQVVENMGNLQVDSLFSEVYKVSKLPIPQLSIQNGTLMVNSTASDDVSSYYFNFEVNDKKIQIEYKNFSNLNVNIEESYGTCLISGYFTDKNSGSMNNGTIYLRSDVSAPIAVKKLPKPNSVYVRDGVVYISFEEGKTIYGAKIALYINGEDVTSGDNTKTSYDFAKNHVENGKYTVYARAISQMSGSETSVTYSLHGDKSEEISITKLAQVEEISVTAYAPESDGTIASLVTSIGSAGNQLPKSMPYQTGFIRFKAVKDAVRYMIASAIDPEAKYFVDKTANADDYVYVNLQGSIFTAGSNSICITAVGNQKEIIDSQTSETFSFQKLKAPENISVQNGKIVWTDTNNPNNSSLKNGSLFGYNYPEWLIDSSKNAIVYYALINGRYVCTQDLTSMAGLNLDELCRLTNSLKDLSFDPNLETTVANVYTIQICASPLNSYVDSSLWEFATSDNVMELSAKRTDSIYVNSDFSSSILVSPITAPYGLTIENKILTWLTPYSDPTSAESISLYQNGNGFEAYGYQLKVYKDGEVQYFDNAGNYRPYYASAENEETGEIETVKVNYYMDRNNPDAVWVSDIDDGFVLTDNLVSVELLDYITISGAGNTSWNFANTDEQVESQFGTAYLKPFSNTAGDYSFEVKTLVRQLGSSPSVYYVNSAYSLSFNTVVLEKPVPGVMDGKIAWRLVSDSTGYSIKIDGTEYNTYDHADKFELKDEIYTFVGNLSDGEHAVTITANGGDEKNLISSLPSEEITYTKLKKIALYVDSNSGLIKFDENWDGNPQHLVGDVDIWSYCVQIDGFEDYDNSQLTTFDMSQSYNEYTGGSIYKINVIAKSKQINFVEGSESAGKRILTSDVSDNFWVYKLATPSKFEVVDNYQSISWSNKDVYVKDLRYIVSVANNAISTGVQTTYSFDENGEVNANVFVCAIYDGTVTIDGKTYNCIRSDANELGSNGNGVEVHKLSAPTNIKMDNGVLSWTRSLDAETHLVIKGYKDIADDPAKPMYNYDFADELPGSYEIYLYNLVSEDLRERTDEQINLSSKNTKVFKIKKLTTPTKFNIDQTYKIDDGLKKQYTFSFGNVADAISYRLDIKDDESDIYTFGLPKMVGVNSIQLVFDENSLTPAVIDNLDAGDFQIYVKAIGSSVEAADMNENIEVYASSDVNYLTVERLAGTKQIEAEIDDILSGTGTMEQTFTGRLDWQSVDGAKTYFAQIECIDDVDASDFVFVNNGQQVFASGNKKIYQFENTENYCQFAHSGNYNIKIVALPEIVAASKVVDADSYWKLMQSADVILQNTTLSYSLFTDGDGTQDNPYIVSNFEQFNCIKYNIYANYMLGENIDFTNASLFGRSFNTISKFYGQIDGNNKTLKLAYAQNYAGVVETLMVGAKICNLTLLGSVTSLKQADEIVVGGFVSYNYGTIEKCLNKINQIASNGNVFSTIGGIVAINYGTIKQSGNFANIFGNFVGGIVAKMFGELVSECYNGTDGGVSIRAKVAQIPYDIQDITALTHCGFAGGIAGYVESGEIKSCYDYAEVYVDNSTTGTAYVGGIVAYVAENVAIKNCYAIDNYIKNVGRLVRATVSDRAKTGILVGLMSTDAQILNCAAVYQNSSGTITTAQILSDAVGDGYTGNGITAVIKNGASEYQYIYNVVSRDNDGIFVNNTNKYCTLANAKYN